MRRVLNVLTVLLLLPCLPGGTASAQDEALAPADPAEVGMDADRLARVDDVIGEAIEEGITPGAVLLVARGGRIVRHRAYGRRAVVPASETMTLDTIFDLASLTKPMATAASVMKLVERGRVRLQDRVGVYLPEFAAEEKEGIRVDQLLTHTSGLAPYAPVDSLARRFGAPSREGVWTWIVENEPLDEPGSRFRYSDLNYATLARLVERVDGRGLEVFAAEELYVPLGMTDTAFFPPDGVRDRIAPTEASV
ncbi:MAG: serine hydrolase domain-containing protein, partial [bacterium]